MERGVKSAKAKIASRPSVTKQSRKIDGSTRRQLEQHLAEALGQHAAISEILQVISASPSDVQPVLDAVAERAARLCEAPLARVLLVDGDTLRAMAEYSLDGTSQARTVPLPLRRTTIVGRAVLDRVTVHHADVVPLLDNEYPDALNARRLGLRAVLAVPLMREGNAYGVILLWRREPGLFSPDQVALVETFARQAAIAIENVRLFNATKQALDQQTATSEILRIISASPTDIGPVFDAIVRAAARLCGATHCVAARFDGELLHPLAFHGFSPESLEQYAARAFPMRPSRATLMGRTALSRVVEMLPDKLADPDYAHEAKAGDWRSGLAVPMLRDGNLIGVIVVSRREAGTYAEHLVTLLQTFADQAIIAIENVRLFAEVEERTKELTRSVNELRALGEVGQAVSSTLDLSTVLSTIVSRATALTGVDSGSIWEYDEALEEFYVHATHNLADELVDVLRVAPIRKGEGALGRLALTGEPVQIRDIASEATYQTHVRDTLIRCGYRSVLAVPLLCDEKLLGGLIVHRNVAGEFAPPVIELLRSFATQSALAIQNARLFREIEGKSRELEAASRHKSEFLANMSHELRTPLNAIIGFSEVLSEQMFGAVNDKQKEYLADILESGRHLLSLINDILDLPAAIDNALVLVRERASRHGITLGRTVDERLGTIRADERKLKQVLINLLTNALKFTPEGGAVDVRAGRRDGVAEISVTDTGVGIAPEDQAAIFEEFRQVGAASKKIEGTGLGLAISRKFIELHGGEIWVRSEVGAGSTFTFTLPLTTDQRHRAR